MGTDSWVTAEATPTQTLPHPLQSTSAWAERPLQSLQDTTRLRPSRQRFYDVLGKREALGLGTATLGADTTHRFSFLVTTLGTPTGASSASGSGMTNVTGATSCTVSPALPTGLSINGSTCTISGTPTVETSNTTYTVTANISGTTYQGTVWLATVPFGTITSPVMGAELDLGEAMTPIALNYTSQAGSSTVYNGNGTVWVESEMLNSNAPVAVRELVEFRGELYFVGTDNTNGSALWKTDGTVNGTVMVKDILSITGIGYGGVGGDPQTGQRTIKELTVVGDTLFFAAWYSQSDGYELWKSDGTASGTVMVKNINTYGQKGSEPRYLRAADDVLYFFADNTTTSGTSSYLSLWKSDGTTNGTIQLSSSHATNIGMFSTVVGNTIFYNCGELCVSDGTVNGTITIPIGSSSNSLSVPNFVAIGNEVYFNADDGTHGYELWKTDGTVNGTAMVKDINNGGGSGVYYLWGSALGNTLIFRASDGTNGSELWKSDGTAAGTMMLKDIQSGSQSSYVPKDFITLNNHVYFLASTDYGTSTTHYGLWVTDGTSSGTQPVNDTITGIRQVLERPDLRVKTKLFYIRLETLSSCLHKTVCTRRLKVQMNRRKL